VVGSPRPGRSFRLGLTGGIGSGKSVAAQALARRGAAIIDADAISRSVTGPGGAAMPAITANFGAVFLTAEGALNRQAMRDAAFADPGIKVRLEAIIHPLVGKISAEQAQQAAAAGVFCLVFDVPLLVESGHWRSRVDAVLVLDCQVATQIQRVRARSGWDTAAVERVIAAQASRAQRLAAADIVLYNDGITLTALDALVGQCCAKIGLHASPNDAIARL
jgi:dephospho-CoA kinase